MQSNVIQSNPESTSNLFALLIGIDCYLPNKLSNGSSYKNLQGCVYSKPGEA